MKKKIKDFLGMVVFAIATTVLLFVMLCLPL